MKPFNLEQALAGKPVITRDLRKVNEIHHFTTASKDEKFTLYAVVEGAIHSYNVNGSYMSQGTNDADLFMEEPIVEGWMNLYQHNITGEMWTGDVHPTEEKAKSLVKSLSGNYIKTIKVDNKPF